MLCVNFGGCWDRASIVYIRDGCDFRGSSRWYSMLNNGHPKILGPNPWNLWMLLYIVFVQLWLNQWFLRWGHYPKLSKQALNTITNVFIKYRQRETGHTERRGWFDNGSREKIWRCYTIGFEDEGRATSQAMWLKNLEEATNGFSPREPSEGMWPCQHFYFSPVKLILDFWSPELLENKFLLL